MKLTSDMCFMEERRYQLLQPIFYRAPVHRPHFAAVPRPGKHKSAMPGSAGESHWAPCRRDPIIPHSEAAGPTSKRLSVSLWGANMRPHPFGDGFTVDRAGIVHYHPENTRATPLCCRSPPRTNQTKPRKTRYTGNASAPTMQIHGTNGARGTSPVSYKVQSAL